MTLWRVALRGLWFHWRINLSVMLGVAAATAVLTGALLVGDSMRGSLRDLTLEGLGEIDQLLLADQFFRRQLASELSSTEGFSSTFDAAAGAILIPRGAIETRGQQTTARAAGVTVIGATEEFWSLDAREDHPVISLGRDDVALNEALAQELGVEKGDEVTLRLARAAPTPADSALGRKDDLSESVVGLTVVDILPASGLGRFSIFPTQRLPRNVYVSLSRLQEELDQEERINAIFVSSKSAAPTSETASKAESEKLAAMLHPKLADYGFRLERVKRTFPQDDPSGKVIYDYFSLTTDGMIFSSPADKAITRALQGEESQPLFTYLANRISLATGDAEADASNENGIPYSTITAFQPTPSLGPYHDLAGEPIAPLVEDEIVLNEWAADDLDAAGYPLAGGERIAVSFFEPETVHGQTREQTAEFTLKAVVPLTEPAGTYRRGRPPKFNDPPTQANDPNLTPTVPGVTDQETIENWNPPFPFDNRAIREQDEEYWEQHRTTPKAFVSLEAGRKMWGSRFGETTSYRVAHREGLSKADLTARLEKELANVKDKLGLEFLAIKWRNLQSSRGTTSFDYLFLGFSFYLIAAALMLVMLLFRLGAEQRAGEIGTLLAVGLRRPQAGWVLIAEGLLVAAAGAAIGMAAGVGYAWLMIEGLKTLWVEAIVTPFLTLHVTYPSLAIGLLSGALVSLLTMLWALWQMRRVSVRRLMSGPVSDQSLMSHRSRRWPGAAAAALLIGAVILAILATMQLSGEAQAGAFMSSGALVLAAALLWIWASLQSAASSRTTSQLGLAGLAGRNAGRNPARSTLSIGLMAAASFLIVAISAFRLAPTEEGVGGFDLMAESVLPIFADLNTQEGREQLLLNRPELLEGAKVLSCRLLPGENASCRNVMKTSRPRVLGVTPTMVEHFSQPDVRKFAWAATAAETEQEEANPWRLLFEETEDGTTPVVIDKNTAKYSLGLDDVGDELPVQYDADTNVRFRVVGLLSNSVLQGSLLIGEPHFERLFPEISGYQFFLIRAPELSGQEQQTQLAAALEEQLSDQGFDAQATQAVLEDLLAVQNTYLSTFQSLGALGLLLGTFGLATVQLRNVLERRSELALMRATGFRRGRLARMVMMENSLLLVAGLGVGVFAALVAVLPHWLTGGARAPLDQLAVMLAVVLVVGLFSSLAAVRATLKAPVVAALRGE